MAVLWHGQNRLHVRLLSSGDFLPCEPDDCEDFGCSPLEWFELADDLEDRALSPLVCVDTCTALADTTEHKTVHRTFNIFDQYVNAYLNTALTLGQNHQ